MINSTTSVTNTTSVTMVLSKTKKKSAAEKSYQFKMQGWLSNRKLLSSTRTI